MFQTATGDVIWPRHQADVEHHYAPLVVASVDANGHWPLASPDCRKTFVPLPDVKTP